MPSDPVNPHDALFRRVLGEPENAASELRSILPAAVAGQLDLDRLIPVPGSFVDEDLRWRHCDLLFGTRTRDGRDALVYVLMEHQSSPDPWMAWRMWRYVTRIWDRYQAEHRANSTLPLVVPVVVYHGPTPWRHPTELSDLLDLDPAWPDDAGLVPRFRFLLDDLSGMDERALRARPLNDPARVTLFLLVRTADNPGLGAELLTWASDLRAMLNRPGGMATFRAMLSYIEKVGSGSAESLMPVMKKIGPDAEEAYVTIGEQLRAEGWAKGMAEGKAEGKAEGEAEGKAAALLQILELRFGPVPASTVTAIRDAPVEQVEAWTARAITAATIGDAVG